MSTPLGLVAPPKRAPSFGAAFRLGPLGGEEQDQDQQQHDHVDRGAEGKGHTVPPSSPCGLGGLRACHAGPQMGCHATVARSGDATSPRWLAGGSDRSCLRGRGEGRGDPADAPPSIAPASCQVRHQRIANRFRYAQRCPLRAVGLCVMWLLLRCRSEMELGRRTISYLLRWRAPSFGAAFRLRPLLRLDRYDAGVAVVGVAIPEGMIAATTTVAASWPSLRASPPASGGKTA